MVGDDKGKRVKVSSEDNNEHAELLDEKLLHSIEKLQEIQDELEKINEEASDKVLEVEQKYSEIRKTVYVKRNDIIKSIPDFWLTALLSHPALGELVNEEDQKIFKYISSVDVEDNKDVKSGYSIAFNFKENPHFENAKLTKTLTFHDEGPTKVSGTTIKWKEGQGFPNGVDHEKIGNKRSFPEESFFSWFGDDDQKELDDNHDEIADVIKEDLWPNPLTYFNNEAEEDDEEENDGEESDDDDDDEEGDA